MKFVFLCSALAVLLFGCTTETVENSPRFTTKNQPPAGFFDGLADRFTERECNVMRFTCPYGLGRAGEPCDCTDPDGVVIKGWTIK
jgi:hypothetical protein